MQRNSLLAAVVAAAFTLPLTAHAANDGGAEAMFKSMDKNGDGFISKDEAKGSPHEPQFASLDRNGDGKLSRAEHAAAPDHVKAAKAANAGSRAIPPAGSAAEAAAAAGKVK